jgi:transposase
MKRIKLTEVHEGRGVEHARQPRKGRVDEPNPVRSTVEGGLASRIELHVRPLRRQSGFLVATHDPIGAVLDHEQTLDADRKDQQKVERGFRFRKAPWFMVSTRFLKSSERRMALRAVMTLGLLGYAALEHRIRQELAQKGRTFPDQKGKPTERPTVRWVFLFFAGLHLCDMARVFRTKNQAAFCCRCSNSTGDRCFHSS